MDSTRQCERGKVPRLEEILASLDVGVLDLDCARVSILPGDRNPADE